KSSRRGRNPRSSELTRKLLNPARRFVLLGGSRVTTLSRLEGAAALLSGPRNVLSLRTFLHGGPMHTPLKTFTAVPLVSFLVLLVFFSLARPSSALDNGIALTPPMGWNSWNKFGCNVSEDLIKSMADGMVSSGMKDVGYQYVVIDDCWQVSRDNNGNIV